MFSNGANGLYPVQKDREIIGWVKRHAPVIPFMLYPERQKVGYLAQWVTIGRELNARVHVKTMHLCQATIVDPFEHTISYSILDEKEEVSVAPRGLVPKTSRNSVRIVTPRQFLPVDSVLRSHHKAIASWAAFDRSIGVENGFWS